MGVARVGSFAFMLMLCACGDPKVDGSSDEAMKESIAAIKRSLPEAQRAEFEEAVKTVAFGEVDDLPALIAGLETGAFRERLGGRTAPEIIALAKEIKAAQEERRKKEAALEEQERAARAEREEQERAARAEQERKEEEERAREEAERAEERRRKALATIDGLALRLDAEKPEILARFVIEQSTFGYSREFIIEPKITLAVRNETGKAVSRAYFEAVLLTPGRTLPWVEGEFNYAIPGGLEPGEAATWRLAPNMFGKWSDAPKDRDDMVLIVRPIRLDGADGEPLSGEPLPDEDAKRLRELLASAEHDRGAELLAALDARDEAAKAWKAPAVAASVRAELEQLRSRKEAADSAAASLAKFVVEKSRFYWTDDEFLREPVIDLTVRNGTEKAVSRVYCRGVLSSPGRAEPWVDEKFNYEIAGGVQPGEPHRSTLDPNMFGEWGKAPRDRADMVLAVTVLRVEGADGKELFARDFDESAARRLAALEKISSAIAGK